MACCFFSSLAQYIAYNVTYLAKNVTFDAIFVYSANLIAERENLWLEVDIPDSKPCCIEGDINFIQSLSEIMGGCKK